MLRLLASAVDEPHDRKAGNARLQVRLDLDPARLESDESVCQRAREHARDARCRGVAEERRLCTECITSSVGYETW